MPAFVDTMTFGGQLLDFTGASAEKFAGAEYTTSNHGVVASVDTSDGIDLGTLKGNFKDRYHLRLLVGTAFAGTSASKVVIKLYSTDSSSKKCASTDEKLCLTVPVATFNKCTQTPYEISLPPDVCRYNILGVAVVDSSASAVTLTAGSLLATIEDKKW